MNYKTSDIERGGRDWLKICVRFGLFAAIVSSLALAYLGNKEGMTGAIVVVAILLAFAHLDRIESFKGAGFEVKAREVVERAESTIDELRKLATSMAKIQVSLLVRAGRLGGYSETEQIKYREEILKVLQDIGVGTEAQEGCLEDVHRFRERDLARACDKDARVELPVPKSDEFGKEYQSLWDIGTPTPDQLEALYTKWDILKPERQAALADYRYYRQFKRMRDPADFDRRSR